MRSLATATVVLALLAAVAGCSPAGAGDAAGLPREEPTLTGEIIGRERHPQEGLRILVEENRVSPTGEPGLYWLSLESAPVRVLRLSGGRTVAAGIDDLRVGQMVQAWIEGPLLLSYPARGFAPLLVILE